MVRKRLIFLFGSILLAIFIFLRISSPKEMLIDKMASYFASPVIRVASAITNPLKAYLYRRKLKKNLYAVYRDLKKKYLKTMEENISLRGTLEYIKKSKDLIDFKDRYKLEDSILSKILIKNIDSSEHYIVVNRGERHGVKKNMAAIYKFQLIGRVSSVNPNYSKVSLITDSNSKVSAYANSSEVKGVVMGSNNIKTLNLRYVSHLKKLHNGDFVLSSGQGLVFPEGFCLGKIVKIKTQDLCHYIELEPLVKIEELETCILTDISKMNLF